MIKQPYPVLGPHLKIIDKWLEDGQAKAKEATAHGGKGL